ncbi:MAG: sigma 54-interacting transcriptional regulator [Vicinamibacteraceae bacterium]|nr:sigma 54-interacting transcriptional regulator [Vicinamibacteraceae bacterium]
MRARHHVSEAGGEPPLDLSRLLETIPAAAILVDDHMRIVGANPLFRFGRPRHLPIIGRPCYEVSHGRALPCGGERSCCPWREQVGGSPRSQQVHVHATADGDAAEEVWSSAIGPTAGTALVLQIVRAPGSEIAPPPGLLVGRSPAIARLRSRIDECANWWAPVLVRGEPGTEVEIVARELHEAGARNGGRFTVVATAAFATPAARPVWWRRAGPSGSRASGTIFVDDVTKLSASRQRELVVALSSEAERARPDGANHAARWIVGASRGLAGAVAARRLLPELARLLEATEVVVPPLRERTGDLPALVSALRPWLVAPPELQVHGSVVSALAPLPLYGNIWELLARLQDAVLNVRSGPLRAEHLVWSAWPRRRHAAHVHPWGIDIDPHDPGS